MDMVWQSTAKPRHLHTPRTSTQSNETQHGLGPRVVAWTPPPPQLYQHGHPEMNLNDDATFRFAKFKLDGSYSSLKRKRPLTPDLENAKRRTKSAAAVPPQQFQSPIKNEQISINPRPHRPSNVERAENDHAAAFQAQSPHMHGQHQKFCALQNPVTPSSNAPLIHKRPHSASLQMEKSLGIRPFRKDIQVPQGSCPHIPQKDVPHWSQTSDKRPRRQRKELFV